MANRFWVGGSGNFNDTNRWSLTSGGASGASVPTSSDDCFFDANSFTAGSSTVTFNVSVNAKSMDFTGATNSPHVIPTNSATIAGSLTLITGMTWVGNGSITFNTTGVTANLTSAGVLFSIPNIIISGSGTFNMQDNLTINNGSGSGGFKPSSSGTINTNNNNLSCLVWQSQAGSTATINLGSSTITLSDNNGGVSAWVIQAGETLNAGTSIIVFNAPSDTFVGANKTYNTVQVTATGAIISNSNTFSVLTISVGKTINFTNLTTQTVTTLNAVGTSGSHILFRSTVAGSRASLCVTNWNIAYVDAKDINASCNTAVDCTGTNSGNNAGFDFCTGRAFLLNMI